MSSLQLRFQLTQPGFSMDVDLTLPGHGVSALFGPSGSGKTTCLRVLAGLHVYGRCHSTYVALNHEVWQDDHLGRRVPVHRRGLGFVFQDAALFAHLNVADNLAFGLRRVPPPERRVALTQAVELLGIGHLLARASTTLSGGERQRVAIARALASSPRLLLMDEPLAALDGARKADILPYLERLQAELNIPIVYVSHAIDEVARLADHLVLLEAGRVRASGSTPALLTRLDLPMAHGDSAGAVITTTVHAHDLAYHLSTVEFPGGCLTVPLQQLAQGQTLRLRVQARDVSLTLAAQTGTSILNVLAVRVLALVEDSPGHVMVQLDAGGTALLARITCKSRDTLALMVGSRLFAQIKGVAILG